MLDRTFESRACHAQEKDRETEYGILMCGKISDRTHDRHLLEISFHRFRSPSIHDGPSVHQSALPAPARATTTTKTRKREKILQYRIGLSQVVGIIGVDLRYIVTTKTRSNRNKYLYKLQSWSKLTWEREPLWRRYVDNIRRSSLYVIAKKALGNVCAFKRERLFHHRRGPVDHPSVFVHYTPPYLYCI